MSRGIITEIFYDRLYGLIDGDGEKGLYFSRNKVLPKVDDFFYLDEGDLVQFEIGNDDLHLRIATQVKPDRLIDRPGGEFMQAPFTHRGL